MMLCLGRSNFRAGDPPAGSWHAIDPHQAAVAWWDAETLARLAGLVQSKGASLYLFREDQATFSDFQQRPAVLIGAYNDQWTLELMSRMRYTFQRTGQIQWIADRDRPSFQDWKNDLGQTDGQGNLALKQDYAIILRVENPRTGFITVTVAGLWVYGTRAAGRFLTDPQYMQAFCKRTGFKLNKNNMQIVMALRSSRESPGRPRFGRYFLVSPLLVEVSYLSIPHVPTSVTEIPLLRKPHIPGHYRSARGTLPQVPCGALRERM